MLRRSFYFLVLSFGILLFNSCKKEEPQSPPVQKVPADACSDFQIEFQVEMFNQDPSVDRNSIALEVDINGVKKTLNLCLEPTHLFNRITLKDVWTFKSSLTSSFHVEYRITPRFDYCGNGATYYNFETDIGEFNITCDKANVVHKVLIPLIQ